MRDVLTMVLIAIGVAVVVFAAFYFFGVEIDI